MKKGKLYVVGIGPGSYEDMTVRAINALKESETIVGYTVYCGLVRPYYPDKEYIATPMMGEEKRVILAFEEADKGKTVSLVCSGDAGVYGMAGLVCGMASEHTGTEVEVIPGVTAALSGAAILGAPLIHDMCLISLSDRLTPMETIEKRLRAAADSGMVIVLYNPQSKSRKDHLKKACDVVSEYLPPETVCGLVKNIAREGQESRIMTLAELMEAEADMFTTVFIGNPTTKESGGYMVTSRGYLSER